MYWYMEGLYGNWWELVVVGSLFYGIVIVIIFLLMF